MGWGWGILLPRPKAQGRAPCRGNTAARGSRGDYYLVFPSILPDGPPLSGLDYVHSGGPRGQPNYQSILVICTDFHRFFRFLSSLETAHQPNALVLLVWMCRHTEERLLNCDYHKKDTRSADVRALPQTALRRVYFYASSLFQLRCPQ